MLTYEQAVAMQRAIAKHFAAIAATRTHPPTKQEEAHERRVRRSVNKVAYEAFNRKYTYDGHN